MTAESVSKRLRLMTLALLGLIAAQALVSLSGCHEEPLPMGAHRVAPR